MGGRGDLKARAEAEAQRTRKDVVEIGEQVSIVSPQIQKLEQDLE
jgi:hypothetical protein